MIRIGGFNTIQAWIISKKGLVKKTIQEKKDVFIYNNKKYFVVQDSIVLKSGIIFSKKILLYFENIPIPIDIKQLKIEGKLSEIILNGSVIHNLASIDLLDVLTKKKFGKFELILIFMMLINICVTGVCIYGVYT